MKLIRDAHKNKYMLALSLVAGMSCAPFGYAMDPESPKYAGLHAEITREALVGVLGDQNLEAVIEANLSQDAAGSEGALEKRRHFDATTLNSSVQYINREQAKALNFALEADTEPDSRSDALRHLGLMLHTVQDFYTRSNYVENALEHPENKADPYNLPLVDWTKVQSGMKLTAAKHGDPEDVLNKDASTAAGGKVVLADKVTQHSVARDLAVRETQRQWNLFETLVRSKAGDRAPAILAALRKASTPSAAEAKAMKEKEVQTIVGDPQGLPDNTGVPGLEDADRGP